MVTYDEFKQFYKKFPKRDNKFYYQQFPEGNKNTIRNYKYRCGIIEKTTATHDATNNKKITKSNQKTPNQPPKQEKNIIDDPDELLYSVAMRELNKTNPNHQWARILIEVRKENISQSKKEGKIRSKFKSMNIKEVAKISAEKPTDTSQKPDFKESS